MCLRYRVMVAVRGTPSGVPGALIPGFPTPRTAATQSHRKGRLRLPTVKELDNAHNQSVQNLHLQSPRYVLEHLH